MDGVAQPPLFSEVFEAQVAKISKSIVGNRRDGNGIDEGLVVDPVLRDDLDLGFFVVDEVEVVQVGDVLVDAVGYENIPLAVVVHVKKQCSPAPVGSFHVGQSSHLAKGPVSIVEVEHVAGKLVMVAVGLVELKLIPVLEGGHLLQSGRGLREHVCYKDIQESVSIEVGDVCSHGGRADRAHGRFERLGEGAVLVVDVEVVALKKIVGNEDIGPGILVYIADGDAQAKPNHGAINACFFTYIGKFFSVVTEEFVSAHRIAHGPLVLHLVEGADGLVGIIE